MLATPFPAGAQTPAPAANATLTGDWGGLRTRLQDLGITPALQEQSEAWGNLTGGLQRGATYDGATLGSLTLDLGKLLHWPGATVFASAYQIHGNGPTQTLVGNLQTVSSIEATDSFRLYDLWLEQSLFGGRVSIRFGQEGFDDTFTSPSGTSSYEFTVTQYGSLFLNSSFGSAGLEAVDLTSGGPTYPLSAPFVRVKVQASARITLLAGVYTADPAPAGLGNPQMGDLHGTAFRLNDHALTLAELWYSPDRSAVLPTTYKLGGWFESGHFPSPVTAQGGRSLADPASNGIPLSYSSNFGVYGIIDQAVWTRPGHDDQGIGVFLQATAAPGNRNTSNLFVEAGANFKAPFPARPDDSLEVAVAYLGISPSLRQFGNDVVRFTGAGSPYNVNETVIEATYVIQATPWFAVQPDLQVVINPGAGIPSSFSSTPLKDAVVIGTHATITF